jgi:hypothetical protein
MLAKAKPDQCESGYFVHIQSTNIQTGTKLTPYSGGLYEKTGGGRVWVWYGKVTTLAMEFADDAQPSGWS